MRCVFCVCRLCHCDVCFTAEYYHASCFIDVFHGNVPDGLCLFIISNCFCSFDFLFITTQQQDNTINVHWIQAFNLVIKKIADWFNLSVSPVTAWTVSEWCRRIWMQAVHTQRETLSQVALCVSLCVAGLFCYRYFFIIARCSGGTSAQRTTE
jgi:hypothetical protein